MIVFDLLLRLSLLVTIVVISGFIDKVWNRDTNLGKILQGLLFGLASIVAMQFPYVIEQGLIFDGRTILISLCTLFFGPLSGGISALLALIYRIYIGGVGVTMGIATILEAFIIGYIFHSIKSKRDIFWLTTGRLYLFGLLVHIVMGLLIFTLPSKYAKEVLSDVALTIIIIYPLISLLIAKILYDQEVSSRYLKDLHFRERLYRTTLYSIGDAVITTDANGYVHNINSVAEKLTGWKENEALGHKIDRVFDIYNELTGAKAENPVSRVLREGKVIGLANHTVLKSRDGRMVPIADSGAPIRDEYGNINGVVLVFRDQTKEREYLKKIEESEKRYRQFVELSPDGIWRFDLRTPIPINLPPEQQIEMMFEHGYLAECNDVYAKMYGFESPNEIVGANLKDLLDPNDINNIEYLRNFIENGYQLTGGISKEFDRYGNVKYFENNLVGIIEDGILIRAWGIQKDITERQQLEEALRESEAKFRLLADASLVGIYLIQDYKFTYVNKSLANTFGYEVEEVIGKLGPLDLTHPDDHPRVVENINKRVSGEVESINYSFKGIRKDGSTLLVEVFGRRIEYQGKPGLIGTLMDITEKARLEEENRIKTLQLESTLEFTPNVAIQFYDKEGKIIYWNQASTQLYGYTKEEAHGKTLDQLIWTKEQAEEYKQELKKIAETGKPLGPFESEIRRKDGTVGWILSTTFAIPSGKEEPIFVCMDIDITDRKKVEEELKDQKELFKTLLETTGGGIIAYRVGDILFANQAMVDITGYTFEELYSMPAWDVAHPDQREEVKRTITKRFGGETVPGHYEVKLQTKEGKIRWVDYSARSFVWKGKLTALGTAIDITDRKINEELVRIQYNIADALVKEKSLYKFFEVVRNELSKVIDTKNLFVAFYDEEKDELYSPFEWDEKMDAPVRWSAKGSLTGKVVKERRTLLLKRDDIQKLLEQGEIEIIGSRSECWLGVPLTVENKPYGAIVVQSYDNPDAYDERSVKLMELVAAQLSTYIIQKMQTEELVKLSKAVEKSQVGIIISDKNGTIEYVNPKMSEITGYSADELIGNNPRILKSGYHPKKFYEHLWNTVLSGRDWKGEFRNKRKNGELYWSREIISPIFDEEGRITHFVSIGEDVTEQKRLIEDLVNAKEKALESERLKTAFLANVSHEVRTPLNGLMGFAQVLETQTLTPTEVKRFAGIILRRAKDLLSLFNDILDMSLIEANQLKINPKPVEINKILYEVYSDFLLNEKVQKKEVDLRIGKALRDDTVIVTDPVRLKQILSNLVENGIKFTKKGYVEFGSKLLETGDIEFYVKDTGIGIPKSKLSTIFERFQQIDTDILRKEYEGVGLGLPICKGLVKLLNGKIWVESEVGVGSTFYFTISPIQEQSLEGERKDEGDLGFENELEKNLYKGKVVFLVAEDDFVNYVLLERLLKNKFDCEVIRAITGKDVIERIKERKDINLILLDIRLPIMDGFTAFGEVKKINPSVPIIAVTAYAYAEDRKKIMEMGFDDYVAKPFDLKELISKINKILKEKHPETS